MRSAGAFAGFSLISSGSLVDDLLLHSKHFCGPREIRTLDLLNAIETRSQLRYGPILFPVDLEGFEPSASSVRLTRAPNCATGPKFGRANFTQLPILCQDYPAVCEYTIGMPSLLRAGH